MRFNFCENTSFKTPEAAPIISLHALEYLKQKRSEFSEEEKTAFDALLEHLPKTRATLRSSTLHNDAPMEDLSINGYDDWSDDPEYYDCDKNTVVVCIPGISRSDLSPSYSSVAEQIFQPTHESMGWDVVALQPYLGDLHALCFNYDISFGVEHIQQIIEYQDKMKSGQCCIHEITVDDYAQAAGVVLYNTTNHVYFSAVVHNSMRTSALMGAKIFPNDEMAFNALGHHVQKDEWLTVPAAVSLNGVVMTNDVVLNDAMAVAQKLRLDNQLLEEENRRLRAQLGMDVSSKRMKM